MASLKLFNVANIDNALVDIYTCPPSTAALVHCLILCNIDASDIAVDVTVLDSSAGVTTYLVKGATVKAGGSLVVLGDNMKLALEASDKIQARATSGTNVLDVTGAVLEEGV
jgi:hypothetical protein